jgi:hypothetical protein
MTPAAQLKQLLPAVHDDMKEYVLSKGSPVSSRRAR